MRSQYYILILCCGLFAACNSTHEEPQFPFEETLTQELMPLQGITDPFMLEVKHPFLIVQNMQRSDSILHVYDLTNYELKSAFGREGRGPGEFGFMQLYQTPFSDIFIGDINTNVVFRYGIDEEGQSVHKETIESKYKGNHSIAGAAFINDSLYVLADALYMPGGNIDLLSLQSEVAIRTKPYRNLDISDPEKDIDLGYTYVNESRIALAYGYKKQIDFMDADLNLIKRVEFKYDYPTDVTNRGDRKWSYGYSYFGKHYYYTLFYGISEDEYNARSFSNISLEVFDLDGNPVAKYYLDGIIPDNFVVDEETFTLYGVLYDNAEFVDCLPVYRLKGLR